MPRQAWARALVPKLNSSAVKEADDGCVAFERLEGADEISPLVGRELGENQRSKATMKLSPSSISRGSVPLNAFIPATIFRGMPIPMCSK